MSRKNNPGADGAGVETVGLISNFSALEYRQLTRWLKGSDIARPGD